MSFNNEKFTFSAATSALPANIVADGWWPKHDETQRFHAERGHEEQQQPAQNQPERKYRRRTEHRQLPDFPEHNASLQPVEPNESAEADGHAPAAPGAVPAQSRATESDKEPQCWLPDAVDTGERRLYTQSNHRASELSRRFQLHVH